MTWHVDEGMLNRYSAGEIDGARAASIEAHVIGCGECRSRVASLVEPARTERMWRQIRDTIDMPRRRFVESILVRVGVRDHHARLIAATPALTMSWLVAVAVTLGWGVVAARAGTRGVLAFLIVAPVIPLAGIALAYGPRIDPTYEVGVATPIHGIRLMLLRAGCVIAATMLLTGVASLALPSVGWKAVAWLLPSLGVSLACLALATWLDPLWAAVVVGFSWITTASVGATLRRGVPALDRVSAFEPGGQALFAIMAVIAAVVLVRRGNRRDIGGIS